MDSNLQHEGTVRGESNLASLGGCQYADPVVLVGEVLPGPTVVVEGLNDGHGVEVVLETSRWSLKIGCYVSD